MMQNVRKLFADGAIKENYVFLLLLLMVIGFGMLGLIKPEKTISLTENRTLTKFEHFTLKKFLDGSFQDNFENAISDQFLKSEEIRVGYGQVINNLPNYGINSLFCTNRYVDVPSSTKDKRAFFDCGDYMVAYPQAMSEKSMALYHQFVKNYNRVNGMADVYYYFILNSNVRNFETGESVIDAETMLNEDLKGNYTLDFFRADNYEAHKKYFYKTDHHWNHVGQYEGYLGIAKMFGVTEPIERPKESTNHDICQGSSADVTLYYNVKEEFYYYDYDLPKHDTYVNGKKTEYGHLNEYKNHKYSKDDITNCYGYVYGNNNAEVIFDYHQPEKENLLIISNSYMNPIKSLIASHFNKTYAVDLRNYKKSLNKEFIIKDYIKERNITKVLFVMTSGFLYSEELNQGLEL